MNAFFGVVLGYKVNVYFLEPLLTVVEGGFLGEIVEEEDSDGLAIVAN